jgi:hypothetical protein
MTGGVRDAVFVAQYERQGLSVGVVVGVMRDIDVSTETSCLVHE